MQAAVSAQVVIGIATSSLHVKFNSTHAVMIEAVPHVVMQECILAPDLLCTARPGHSCTHDCDMLQQSALAIAVPTSTTAN